MQDQQPLTLDTVPMGKDKPDFQLTASQKRIMNVYLNAHEHK